jgi:hypothetical protein
MPAAPKNPVKGTTIQAGCNKNTDTARMPPAWVVFTNERDTGAGVNRVPLGFPNSSQLGGATNLLGVTIGGICDAAAAAKFPESEGRYAVAVEGKVVVALVLESGKLPKVNERVYISMNRMSVHYVKINGEDTHFPFATVSPSGGKLLGMVTWTNPEFARTKVAEVEVLLEIY